MAKQNDAKIAKKVNNGDKIATVLTKNKNVFIGVLCAVVVCLAGLVVFHFVSNSAKDKDLGAIEQAEYLLTKDTAALSDEELAPYYEKAESAIEAYVNKGGIVGARASLLKAEIEFRKNNFDDARELYEKAASKVKKTYLAPICYYNAAVACEEMNDSEKAIEYYTMAAEHKEFADPTHAYFAVGRLKEAALDYIGAKEAYEKCSAKDNAQDPWSNLAKTRIISMQIDGKIE